MILFIREHAETADFWLRFTLSFAGVVTILYGFKKFVWQHVREKILSFLNEAFFGGYDAILDQQKDMIAKQALNISNMKNVMNDMQGAVDEQKEVIDRQKEINDDQANTMYRLQDVIDTISTRQANNHNLIIAHARLDLEHICNRACARGYIFPEEATRIRQLYKPYKGCNGNHIENLVETSLGLEQITQDEYRQRKHIEKESQ